MKKCKMILVALWLMAALSASAQDAYQFMPLIYERQATADSVAAAQPNGLKADDTWLREAQRVRQEAQRRRHALAIGNPDLVRYNADSLPEAPSAVVVKADPSASLLAVEEKSLPTPAVPEDGRAAKVHNWLHTFNASLHFTQCYLSDNWYQGGQNNLNVLGDLNWEFNLNQTLHPKWLFNNTLHYKLGVSTASGDSLRNYHLNEDLLQFNSQLGYKAVEHWYYSANLQFKTQFFKNYKTNTRDLTAAFLSPGELTLGLGMTYNYKDKEEIKVFTLALSPLSYNLKICRDIVNLDPTTFGIDEGHHTKHSFGSSLEGKFTWKITPNIIWTSRLYAFTDYHYGQGDWENTLDFSINKYLNTKIFTHLRFDSSAPRHADWRYWQFKEILSFGLTYRFSTN
ncbi:MAG: DUF3078 domain-containing protein [Muribaculaceae bacterium]|nr:DUF3078 domain-containing protein [Muribaculaceae bacterium]